MLWFGLFVYVHLEVYVSIVSLSASLPVIRMQKISEKKNNTSGITVNETKWTTLNCNDYSVMLNTLLKTTKIMLKRKTFTHTNTHKRTKNLCPRIHTQTHTKELKICVPEEFFQSFLCPRKLIYAILTPENYKSN